MAVWVWLSGNRPYVRKALMPGDRLAPGNRSGRILRPIKGAGVCIRQDKPIDPLWIKPVENLRKHAAPGEAEKMGPAASDSIGNGKPIHFRPHKFAGIHRLSVSLASYRFFWTISHAAQ
jgi:hypothetical protein